MRFTSPRTSFNILFFLFLPIPAQDTPMQVNGVLRQPVRLSSNLNFTSAVEDVRWLYKTGGGSSMIAEFKNSNFEIYEDRYRNRIETSKDGTELLIRDLGEGDSGVYHQIIVFANKKAHEFLFNLTVYEPVPSPVIQDELEKKTAAWCNLTLRCSVPLNTSALSISWLCRYKDSECCNPRTACDDNNGSAVRLSLQPGSWDMEIMCLAQNPADRKNASFHTQNICLPSENKSTMEGRSYHVWIPILLGVLLLMIILIFSKWKRKRKGIPENRAIQDAEYFDVETFRGGRDQNVVDKSEEHASTYEIVYSELQHPPT